jgi:hypothetical protein
MVSELSRYLSKAASWIEIREIHNHSEVIGSKPAHIYLITNKGLIDISYIQRIMCDFPYIYEVEQGNFIDPINDIGFIKRQRIVIKHTDQIRGQFKISSIAKIAILVILFGLVIKILYNLITNVRL